MAGCGKTTNPVFIMQNIGVIAMDGNRIIWRLADLILLRAECRAHLGMTTEALKDLDRIRDRAGLKGYTGATNKTSLLKEIFHEREENCSAKANVILILSVTVISGKN